MAFGTAAGSSFELRGHLLPLELSCLAIFRPGLLLCDGFTSADGQELAQANLSGRLRN